jgi:hypothetical protein
VMSEFPNFEKYCLDILETHLWFKHLLIFS